MCLSVRISKPLKLCTEFDDRYFMASNVLRLLNKLPFLERVDWSSSRLHILHRAWDWPVRLLPLLDR